MVEAELLLAPTLYEEKIAAFARDTTTHTWAVILAFLSALYR